MGCRVHWKYSTKTKGTETVYNTSGLRWRMERSSSEHVIHWGSMVKGINRNVSDLFVCISLHLQQLILCYFIGMGTMEWKPSSWIPKLWWFWWDRLGLGRKWRWNVWDVKSLRTYSCWRNEPSKYLCLLASVTWLSLY